MNQTSTESMAGTATERVVRRVVQDVSDLPPWAYTFTERPDDLLEVRASDLEQIVRDAVEGTRP